MTLAEVTEKNLRKNNMEVFTAESKEEVYDIVKSLVKKGDTIGFGGSVTLEQTGVTDRLIEDGYNVLDRRKPSLSPEEKKKIFRECFFADVFLTSSNAITKDGLLYNVDGNGNRVAPILYGPDSVIIIAGKNKIVENSEEAVLRIKNVAAPLNCKRLNIKSYCSEKGHCVSLDNNSGELFGGCSSDSRICCDYVICGQQRNKGRIKVILVNEELGY